jgi:hypothetical protein
VHEPTTDLIKFISNNFDLQGKNLYSCIEETVPPWTMKSGALFWPSHTFTCTTDHRLLLVVSSCMQLGLEGVEISADAKTSTISEENASTLMGRMRPPSLSPRGIEGAFYGR